MKIAVIGTGVVGQSIAQKLNSLGHQVMIGTRNVKDLMARSEKDSMGRPPFKDWHVTQAGIALGTNAEAAAFAELIVNATNGQGSLNALKRAGEENLKGKIVLDISNPLDFSKGFPPSLSVSNTDSLGEQIQHKFPDARVVKTLNTMNAYIMVEPSLIPGNHNVFISGNDDQAKETVSQLLQSFGWPAESIIDLGDITTARGTEQLLPIWVRLFGKFQNGMFNFNVVRQ